MAMPGPEPGGPEPGGPEPGGPEPAGPPYAVLGSTGTSSTTVTTRPTLACSTGPVEALPGPAHAFVLRRLFNDHPHQSRHACDRRAMPWQRPAARRPERDSQPRPAPALQPQQPPQCSGGPSQRPGGCSHLTNAGQGSLGLTCGLPRELNRGAALGPCVPQCCGGTAPHQLLTRRAARGRARLGRCGLRPGPLSTPRPALSAAMQGMARKLGAAAGPDGSCAPAGARFTNSPPLSSCSLSPRRTGSLYQRAGPTRVGRLAIFSRH
jgi:hypothetical protein